MKKRLDGWIEVFRAGKHTDSSGRTKEFSRADLDKTVAQYKPDEHEAPVVIGHPQDNGPAYGWVEGVKRDGGMLLAKFKQVEPAFEEMLAAGRFKKRSISLYPDGSLRHVGFLGAQPPAIKGLKDFAFGQDDECRNYEFEEVDMNELEKLKADLAAANTRADKAEKEASDFKEKADKAISDFADASAAAAESEAEWKHKAIEGFVEQGIKDGKMLPSWKEDGLVGFMSALDESEQTYEFSEGKKEAPAAWFKRFISSFSEHPLFKEMVKPGKENDGDGSEFAEDEATAKAIAASTGADV